MAAIQVLVIIRVRYFVMAAFGRKFAKPTESAEK